MVEDYIPTHTIPSTFLFDILQRSTKNMPFSTIIHPKKYPKTSEIIIVDQSALAKSAAWAWYERGSGSDSRSIREVDVWSSKKEPRPSRYKLELLRNQLQLRPNNYKNSLLDNYEIQRISQQLDQYVQSSHAKFHRDDDDDDDHKVFLKKKKGGFWWRHVPVCSSSRNDVVETPRIERRSEKGSVPVVGVLSCRPRPRLVNQSG